jgi:gamma-glutamylcyclotransferase (GGCT)/AIG2-like uncharacterized protein YtfP
MLYFAYGSNMLLDQMRERCPSAAFVCIAFLKGYRLAFRRTAKGKWKGYGVADVVAQPGQVVWGAVFQIEERDVGALDRSEGYRPDREENAYRRVEVRVSRNGDSEPPLTAFTYVVSTREEPNPLPHPDYLARIIAGAKSWNLPEDYVLGLEKIEVKT